MIIHWRVQSDKQGLRTGTSLPEKGESWPHMVEFLKSSSPNGYLIAYVLTPGGDMLEYREGELSKCADDAKTWFDFDYDIACEVHIPQFAK